MLFIATDKLSPQPELAIIAPVVANVALIFRVVVVVMVVFVEYFFSITRDC